MRSDKDIRTETEKEIDDFLSKFESPADESSADYSTYLESEASDETGGTSFAWNDAETDTNAFDGSSIPEAAKSIENVEKSENDDLNIEDNKKKKKEKKQKKDNSKNKKTSTQEIPDKKTEKEEEKKPESVTEKPTYKVDRNRRRKRDLVLTVPFEPDGSEKTDEVKKDIQDALKAALVSGSGADMSKYGKGKKRRAKNKTGAEHPARKVIKDDAERKKAESVKDTDITEKTDNSKSSKSVVKNPDKKVKSKRVEKTSVLIYKLKQRKGDRTLKEFLFLKPNKNYDPSRGDTYEKDGKTVKNKRYRISFLKILGELAAVFLFFVLCGMIYALGVIASAPKYDYKDLYSAVDTSSVIYDDENNPIDNVFYTENRKVIEYKDMPEDLINSFVAIEDKTFWKHHGFNWTRMIGAILSSLTGNGRISGTSTITQQLARNVYLADTKSVRSIKRKLLEMHYASRLEHNLTKEQIIEAYLNTIYLGHGCYGVNAAAKTYFSKDVKDLDLIECAALAALPQSPDTYALLKLQSEAQDAKDSKIIATEPDTIVTNDISKSRRQLTLDLMLEQGMISQSDHDKVYDLKLNDFINPTVNKAGSDYSYFHEYLVDTIINDLVEQRGMTYEDAERMVYTKGLQIYSTIDSTAQKVIVNEFKDDSNFPYVDPPRDENGNMLNSEGEVAMYKYENDFDEDGNFRLSGEGGDVSVNSDGSVTINKGKKLHIYETETAEGTDYSLEFRSYYLYDDNDVLYSISGGYVNVPMGYKSLDSGGNVIISADFFSDPDYSSNVQIDGKDVVFKPGSYSLSTKSRQPQAAMTIVGVGTGEVKAMVGGRTSGGQKLLNRSLNPRQPGSSIKPLSVYGAALQKSYELNKEGKKWKLVDYGIDKQGTKGWGDYITCYSSVEDERLKVEGRYWPNNFSKSFSGKNNFITAIQHSINTCAVKILLQVGADYSINQLEKFGLTTVQDDTSNPVNDVNPAALALGAMCEGVEPIEMALAYASFPGGGKVNTPICYYKVLDRNGEVLLEGKSEQTEALDAGVAWIMRNVLQSVVSSNGYMYVEGVQPGGKTGTTNDEYDIWFDGFTPSYAGALWIGTDENVDMNTTSTPAARLWGKIMNQIPKAKEGAYLEQPSNVIRTSGCYFTKGTETGLTSWSDEEARRKAMEKAKKEAYDKWQKEREKHKVLVPAVTQEVDDPNRPIYGDVLVGYGKVELKYPDGSTVLDENGNPVMVDDPNQPIYQQGVVGYEKMTVVVTPEHYEYEAGWRDGDFKFDSSKYGF